MTKSIFVRLTFALSMVIALMASTACGKSPNAPTTVVVVTVHCNGATSCSVPYGATVAIDWSTSPATNCSGLPSGWTGASGVKTIVVTETQTLTATCGTGTGSVVVTVSAPPPNSSVTVTSKSPDSGGSLQYSEGSTLAFATVNLSYVVSQADQNAANVAGDRIFVYACMSNDINIPTTGACHSDVTSGSSGKFLFQIAMPAINAGTITQTQYLVIRMNRENASDHVIPANKIILLRNEQWVVNFFK